MHSSLDQLSGQGQNVARAQAKRPLARWIVVLLTATGLALALFTAVNQTVPVAHAFSCPLTSYKHCYGLHQWLGRSKGDGVTIDVVPLQCGGCDGFIDNETWYNQDNCVCWIEAGYSTYTHHTTTTVNYFWADIRPGDGQVNEHPLNQIPANDYGNQVALTIVRSGPQTFTVGVHSPYTNLTEYSTRNTMADGNDIQIGQELAGTTGGAYAPKAYYQNNAWYNDSYQRILQQTDGTPQSFNAPPPTMVIAVNASSYPGGYYATFCCGSQPSIAQETAPRASAMDPHPLVSATATRPLGIPAIHPVTGGTTRDAVPNSLISREAVVQYATTMPMFRNTAPAVQPQIMHTQLLTSAAASARLNGEWIGLPDRASVYFVDLQGRFTFTAPRHVLTYQKGYEVFDAHTGNLLLTGGLK